MRCEVVEWMKCDGVALSGRDGGVVILATIGKPPLFLVHRTDSYRSERVVFDLRVIIKLILAETQPSGPPEMVRIFHERCCFDDIGTPSECRNTNLSSEMTSSSPGDDVSITPPSSSPRHGRSNDPSFVVPSFSLPLPSLYSVIQRLVDLLILTSPTSSAHRHLTTALDHAITAATRITTRPLCPSHRPPLISRPSTTTPLVHRRRPLTIRILTPILPLSPSPPSTPSQSLSSGARSTLSRQLNPRVYAAVESLLSVQLEGGETTGAESGKRVEAAPKALDETTINTPTENTHPSLLPCSAAPAVEPQFKPSPECASVGDRRWSVVEKKKLRRSQRIKKMMP